MKTTNCLARRSAVLSASMLAAVAAASFMLPAGARAAGTAGADTAASDTLEVVMVTERQMVADWKAVVEAVDDPLERIVTGLDHAEARCADQPEFVRLLLDLYTVSLSSPALRVRCARLRTHLVDEVEIEVRQVLGRLPAYSLVAPRELAGAILSAIDGIALSVLVVQQPAAAPFRALKVLLLSLVVTAYVTAGQEPPIARLGEMLSRHP